MELNHEISNDTPRDAASIVLLRDAPAGLEVFLLQRHAASADLGGAYVFPGGKLDAGDCDPALATALQLDPEQLRANLGEPDTPALKALGLYAAALRETQEEADVKLDAKQIHPWSRWITPPIPAFRSKRFDTRFFVAHMPPNQTANHDNHEATHSLWLTPRQALERYWNGEIAFAPPQIMGLAHLARHASAESVIDEARRRLPPLILPHTLEVDGIRMMCYPSDPEHPVLQRALPGPTRLHLRHKRFEPVGGFEGFFE